MPREVEIRNYDRLFTLADMSQVPEDRDYKEFLNPESLVVGSGLAEPALLDDASGIAVHPASPSSTRRFRSRIRTGRNSRTDFQLLKHENSRTQIRLFLLVLA